jgi:Flp pilus assembly protein TadB
MWAWFSPRLAGALAPLGAALAALAAVFWMGRQSAAERAARRAAEQRAAASEARARADNDAAAEPDPHQRLRDAWRR